MYSHFDRHDVCAAYYHFAGLLTNLEDYGGLCRIDDVLSRIGYRPGLSDSRLSSISPNAKAIYMRLVRAKFGVNGLRVDY